MQLEEGFAGVIKGTGIDIASISRMEKALSRFGGRFLRRMLSPEEEALFPAGTKRAASFLAGRWAAKEAAVKALGTGFAGGVAPTDISVLALPSGQPSLRFSGRALECACALGVTAVHVSITHDAGFAAAVVLLEGGRPES